MSSKKVAASEQIRVTVPSRLDFLGILNHTISELGEYLELEEEVVDALAIAVIEAGTNAIQHGAGDDGSGKIDFRFEISDAAVNVRVQDDGPGFDLTKVTGATAGPEGLLESRGRGIFLMRSFMDRVDFVFGADGGTTVQLYKERPPRDHGGA